MKKIVIRMIALTLVMLFVFAGCGPVTEEPSDSKADTTDAVVDSAEGSEKVDTTQTEAEQTTEKPEETTSGIYIARPEKQVKNILMIGNSFCYYYTEELYGIAKADGIILNVANLYESGCPVADHWAWWNANKAEYDLRLVSEKTRGYAQTIGGKTTVAAALSYAKENLGGDWDVITLQQHFNPTRALNYSTGLQDTQLYTKKLFNKLREEHPESTLLWHETWAFEVGYAVPEKYVGTPKQDTPIPDVASQTKSYENIKKVCTLMAEQNKVNMIPCGDAWQIARADSRVGDTMCKRLGTNGDLGDYYHDGDIGGGQYLNACVWYEVLTAKSCIGNKWRPNYELSEEKITALQEAAHKAVAALYGPEYAQ